MIDSEVTAGQAVSVGQVVDVIAEMGGEHAFNLQTQGGESEFATQGDHLVRCQKAPFTGPSQSACAWSG